MSYAKQQDLIVRFGEPELQALAPTDDGDIDGYPVARALRDADAEIDAILAIRYPVPISPVPPHLVRVACDLARFNLYDHDVPEAVSNLRDSGLAWLREVAAGKATLPDVTALEAAADDSVGSAEIVGPGRVFSRDTLKDY